MTANWAFAPVCGVDFWRVIVTSPEVMIFLFFMITDPKTVPAGRVGRVVFGLLVAATSTLLMAPQTNEFGTKVGLIAGLVVVCAVRPLLDRVLPEPRSAADDIRRFASSLVTGGAARPGIVRGAIRGGLAVVAVLVLGVAVVAAGTPARGLVVPDTTEMLDGVPRVIDPATLPAITVSQNVSDFDHTIPAAAPEILVTLAQNLEIENQALLRADASLLTAVDHGDRLKEMQARLRDATTSGRTVVDHYRFDTVHVVLIVPFGVQTGAEPRVPVPGHRHRGDVRRPRRPAVAEDVAVLADVRDPAGDRRALAQRGRAAPGDRQLIGPGRPSRTALSHTRADWPLERQEKARMARDEERLSRSQEEPIVGGLPDVPGILAAIRLTPGLGVHLRGLADELLVNDFPGATIQRGEREMLATAVSAANDCFYCMAESSAPPRHRPLPAWESGDKRLFSTAFLPARAAVRSNHWPRSIRGRWSRSPRDERAACGPCARGPLRPAVVWPARQRTIDVSLFAASCNGGPC